MNTSQRIVFGTGQRGGHHLLPEVLEVGWGNFALACPGHLAPHAHPGAYELCFILSGEVEWGTGDSLDVLRERDVYVTQPDEEHWGRDAAMHPCTLYWVILGSLDHGFTWPDLDPRVADLLSSQLQIIRTHRLRGTRKLCDAFQELFEEHGSAGNTPEQRSLQIANARTALHRLLIELIRVHDQQRTHGIATEPERPLPQSTRTAIEMLHREAHDPDVIHRMCMSIGTDYRTLNEQFLEYVGATISQYWLRERIRLARKRLVESDASITDVAAEFGFSSSQHFATVFRRTTGLTPSQCRKSADSVNTQNRDTR
jgi:AraC family L-rhamnose operon regulatory protein RhaS